MASKYIVYVAIIFVSAVQADTTKVHPNELSIFSKQLIRRNIDHIKDIIPSAFFSVGRYKREVPPSQEDAESVLPFQEDETNSRIRLIPSPLSIFDSLLDMLKKMLFAATDPIISAARDFVLGFFDGTITGLVQFTKKSEPPSLFSSIVAHTLNSFIKRGVDFLVYLRETIRYFFNMFISSSNKRTIRAVDDPSSQNPVLRSVIVNLLNTIIGNFNDITGGRLYPQLARLHGYITVWIDKIFDYPELRQIISLDHQSSKAALKNILINMLNFAIGSVNTITGSIFFQELAILHGLLTNLVDEIFPSY